MTCTCNQVHLQQLSTVPCTSNNNLRQRTQGVGESFDDFLVSLRELTKTCNFCSNDCLQKALRDQIIEGLRDGDIIEELNCK